MRMIVGLPGRCIVVYETFNFPVMIRIMRKVVLG